MPFIIYGSMGVPFIFFFFCIISNIDFHILLYNLQYTADLDWSFDLISSENILTEKEFNIDYMYDPVKEAVSQNQAGASNSSGGGPSQPQGGGNGSGPSQPQGGWITDTTRLADHLTRYKGGAIWNARIETVDNTGYVSPEVNYMNRIWANVKTEHPEFIQNHTFGSQRITKTLLNQIYSLNKNYPK